jgi:hypothetical protein
VKYSERRIEILVILLVVAATLFVFRMAVEDSELFVCDLNGVMLTTTRAELEKHGPLLFGYLEDGREIAVGRYNLERCKRWQS